MPRRQLPYSEGDCFCVPLRDGRYAVGVVARLDGKGGVIGYFFGPVFRNATASLCTHRIPRDAVLIANCGDLGLMRREWKVLGRIVPWDREAWPVPIFVRKDVISGVLRKVVYREPDFNTEAEISPCSPKEADHLPKDGVMGYRAVESRLTKLLSDSKALPSRARS